MTTTPAVRPYRPGDQAALEDICIRTGHEGGDTRPRFADPGIFPATFASPYVHLEPDLVFVLDDGRGQAVGYVLGTADTLAFVERFRSIWLPLVADHYPRPEGEPRTPDEEIAGLLHTPERMILPELAAYPAHLHIDLLPDWQRRGHGRTLMQTFLRALFDRGVPAVHLTMATVNTAARAFYDRLDFHEIEVSAPGPVTHLGRTTGEARPA